MKIDLELLETAIQALKVGRILRGEPPNQYSDWTPPNAYEDNHGEIDYHKYDHSNIFRSSY